jgi:hypothetical protein
MRLALAILAVLATSAASARNPGAERSFLGGNVDMDLVRSNKPLPFTPVPFKSAADAASSTEGAHSVTAEALKSRFASLHKRASLRAGSAQSERKTAVLAPHIAVEAQLVQLGAKSPHLETMKGQNMDDHPMTEVMRETIAHMGEALDYEQLRLYGCSPGARFGHPLAIEPPSGEGFRRGTMIHYLRDRYDLSVVPTSCCNKRVRLGDGQYLPLTEFLAIMIRQMRDSDGGLMRVDLQSTFPPAFDFLCAGLAGSPDSVVTPQYRLKGGAQIAGVLGRIDKALSGMVDVCTGKDDGDPITEWLTQTTSLRQQACEASSLV